MEKKIFTVREFNNEVKSLLESDFYLIGVLIKGEVTSLNKHYTGHYYFSIKDENSKISCMMFSFNVNNCRDNKRRRVDKSPLHKNLK